LSFTDATCHVFDSGTARSRFSYAISQLIARHLNGNPPIEGGAVTIDCSGLTNVTLEYMLTSSLPGGPLIIEIFMHVCKVVFAKFKL